MADKRVASLATVVAVGAVAAAKGVADMAHSHKLAKAARARHEVALADLEVAQVPVHHLVAAYGVQMIETVTMTLGRFADWVERNEMAVNRLGHDPVAGVEVSVPELPDLKNEIRQARAWIKGGAAGATAAVAAPQAALLGVSTLATASTGTAISTLSGAAATNATLAWLGGGSLAAGGGGMATGSAVLGLIAAAPAAFIGGITVAVVGSKQKTRAKQYAAEVGVAIENVQTAIALMPKISERVGELSGVLRSLARRADAAIDRLEALDFDPDQHAADFSTAIQLVRASREVVNTPLLDEETGELTDVSLTIVRKYQ